LVIRQSNYMPSARRQRYFKKKQKNKVHLNFSLRVNKKLVIYVSLVFSLLFLVFTVSLVSSKRFWNGQDKVAVAVNDGVGASVLLFDPQYNEVIVVKIPRHTEVEAAKQLGLWKIETLWELGKQEKVSGQLLADTITKHFRFPVAAWADNQALALSEGRLRGLYQAAFNIYETNLTIGDRVAMAWFSLNVDNARRTEIDLSKTGFLKETTLSDGSEGYTKVEPPPQKVLALFADSDIASSSFAVGITDATGENLVAKNVGQIVQVLGAKIAAVDRKSQENIDCVVKGRNELLRERIAQLFSCDSEGANTGLDVEIILGSKFAKRF
jgi:hypothetical protein